MKGLVQCYIAQGGRNTSPSTTMATAVVDLGIAVYGREGKGSPLGLDLLIRSHS